MTLSPKMKLRLDKIDLLVEKGYSVKTRKGVFLPVLISPNGKSLNIFFRSKHEDNFLPGFSWIAFFFPYVFAAKIKDWKYFQYICGMHFLYAILEFYFQVNSNILITILIPLLYGFGYPLRRWLFVKSNKVEIGIFPSVLLGVLLHFIAGIPAMVFTIANPS